MRTYAFTVLAAGLLVVGCGGEGEDPDPITSPTGAASASSPGKPGPPVTPALRSELLQPVPVQLEELPTGWTEASTDDESGGDFKGDCGRRFENIDNDEYEDDPRASVVRVAYAQGEVTELDQSITSLPSDVTVNTGFDELAGIIKDCPQVDVENEGQEFSLKLGRTSFPALGDESLAFTGTAELEGFSFVLVTSLVRVGNTYISTQVSDLGAPDLDLLEETARLATTRLQAVS